MGRTSRAWIPVLALTALCAGSDPAPAVTQVEVKDWQLPGGFPGTVLAMFDAQVTSTDVGAGVTFSLQERDPGGNDLILNAVLPWTAPYPAVGTEIRVRADFGVSCGPVGFSGISVYAWHVTWCDLALGTQVRLGGQTPAQAVGSSEFEPSYEFAIVDENGVEGANPTPENAFGCGSVTAKARQPEVPNPYHLVQAGLPVPTQTDAQVYPRIDPEVQSEFAGTIGLYFEPTGHITCGDIPAGTSALLYVVARTAGPTRCGITGAELRLDALPAGWTAQVTVPPDAIQIGNPLTSPGGNMAFRSCQSGGAGYVLLYTIEVFAMSAVSDHVVNVVARNPPTNLDFPCPLITLCDAPNYSIVCMTGLQARINPPPGTKCDVPIGVEPRTWSALKWLYE